MDNGVLNFFLVCLETIFIGAKGLYGSEVISYSAQETISSISYPTGITCMKDKHLNPCTISLTLVIWFSEKSQFKLITCLACTQHTISQPSYCIFKERRFINENKKTTYFSYVLSYVLSFFCYNSKAIQIKDVDLEFYAQFIMWYIQNRKPKSIISS